MKSRINIAVAITILLNASCATSYQKAHISRVEESIGRAEKIKHPTLVYQYRIHGLQQMMIYVVPDTSAFSLQKQRDDFTQQELSKLKIKVISLSGRLSVNGLKIEQGKTLLVDLKKEYNMYGKGGVKDFGEYGSIIRFVSYKNAPAGDNLCDFILTIEDPEQVTLATGLRVHGGFTDSL